MGAEGSSSRPHVLSVCEGARVIGEASLFQSHKITTFASAVSELARKYPKYNRVRTTRVVVDRNLISTAGVSAEVEGALTAILILANEAAARKAASAIRFDLADLVPGTTTGLIDMSLNFTDKLQIFRKLATPSKDGTLGFLLHNGIDELTMAAGIDAFNRFSELSNACPMSDTSDKRSTTFELRKKQQLMSQPLDLSAPLHWSVPEWSQSQPGEWNSQGTSQGDEFSPEEDITLPDDDAEDDDPSVWGILHSQIPTLPTIRLGGNSTPPGGSPTRQASSNDDDDDNFVPGALLKEKGTGGGYLFGRHKECAVRFRTARISNRHCLIFKQIAENPDTGRQEES
ncbi:hypothetical protein HK104_005254, partial [Borealophlyctis nickersoniae]